MIFRHRCIYIICAHLCQVYVRLVKCLKYRMCSDRLHTRRAGPQECAQLVEATAQTMVLSMMQGYYKRDRCSRQETGIKIRHVLKEICWGVSPYRYPLPIRRRFLGTILNTVTNRDGTRKNSSREEQGKKSGGRTYHAVK